MRAISFVLLLAAVATITGCGGPTLGRVEGSVRVAGQPLAGVVVTFIPEVERDAAALRSLAQTDRHGRYRLRNEKQQEGAAVGKHRVIVEDLAILSAPRSADGTVVQRPRARFLPAYSDPLRTPLVVEVKPGEQTLDLELSIPP